MKVPLWSLEKGEHAVIAGFNAALPENYKLRLIELGFHVGEAVNCLQKPALGAPRAYRVANSTFSLDDEVAQHIEVERASADTV